MNEVKFTVHTDCKAPICNTAQYKITHKKYRDQFARIKMKQLSILLVGSVLWNK